MASDNPGRHSFAGRIGRGAKPPPQFGQTLLRCRSTQSAQKVHSKVQMRASGGVRRQVLVAIFAIRPKFERHVFSPKPSGAAKRGPAARGTQPQAARHVAIFPPAAESRRPVRRTARVAERGGLMGNRGGRLHRDDQTLSASRWKTKRWLICVCEFKGRRRDVWGRYLHGALFPRRADRARRRTPPVLRVPQASGEGLYRRLSRRPERRRGDGRSAASRAGRESAQTPVAGAARRPAGRGDDRARSARLRGALGRALAVELRGLWRAGAARRRTPSSMS